MNKLLWGRGIAAVVGTFMLVLGTGNAAAQSTSLINTSYSIQKAAVDTTAKPLGASASAPVVNAVQRAVTSTTSMFSNAVGAVFGTSPQSAITKVAREGKWLHNAGWPLYALVDKYSAGFQLDEQATCLATTVYHEARGESLEGQLAVARVVMNRAASHKYPDSWCEVMTQPWQFSFVNPRTGHIPAINYNSASWAKAQGIARLAMADVVPTLPTDVLWYHADYVAPSWGKRLSLVNKIGAHIFYRA